MFDERSNQDHMKFLIDEGMKDCQGPALWVYNNAVFTDNDFDNIVKLGGATKEKDIDKIGTSLLFLVSKIIIKHNKMS